VAGLGGAYLASRALDKAMGTRSPVRAFVERFAGAEPNARPEIPRMNRPTGPQVRPFQSPWERPEPKAPNRNLPVPYEGPTGYKPGDFPPDVVNAGAPQEQLALGFRGDQPINQPAPQQQLALPPPGPVNLPALQMDNPALARAAGRAGVKAALNP